MDRNTISKIEVIGRHNQVAWRVGCKGVEKIVEYSAEFSDSIFNSYTVYGPDSKKIVDIVNAPVVVHYE